MTPSSPIHIAFVSDHNYFHFVLIALHSLLHYHRNGNLVVHLICPDEVSQDTEKLLSLRQVAPFELITHRLDRQKFVKEFGSDRPTLWRLAIPELILDADKLLYLDCDLVFCDDVAKLWGIDLKGNMMAGVGDRAGRKVKLPGLDANRYINAGVMLWNLKRMRDEKVMDTWKRVFREHNCTLKYLDQTLLNLVHRNDILMIPQNWNLHNSIYRNPPLAGMYTDAETIEALANPGIVHFTGHHKPWMLWKFTHHPYAYRFWHFALKAPVPLSFKFKILLKRCMTSSMHEPKVKRAWNASIIKKNV